jgi:hypothetical protein
LKELRQLTNTQRGYISRLRKWKLRVDFLGVDAAGDPVFEVEDRRRTHRLAAFPYPIPAIAGEPAMPLRDLTDEELAVIPHTDYCLMLGVNP